MSYSPPGAPLPACSPVSLDPQPGFFAEGRPRPPPPPQGDDGPEPTSSSPPQSPSSPPLPPQSCSSGGLQPPAAAPTRVSASVEARPGEPAATYVARFSSGGVALGEWPAVRFSVLQRLHNSLPENVGWQWPTFPPLHVFQNFKTDADNVALRGSEVAAYLAALLRCPAPILLPALERAGLPLPPGAAAQAKALNAHARAVAAAAAAVAAAKAEAQMKRARADAAAVHAVASHAAGLAYPQAMPFKLRERFWAAGGADITHATSGMLYFRLARTDVGIFPDLFRDCAFSLTTSTGAPLVHLQERFQWACFEYIVQRHSPAGGPPLHMATVRGRHQWLAADVFEIDAASGVRYRTEGSFRRRSSPFVIFQNGTEEVARIKIEPYSFTDTYTIIIAAGQDTLLLVSVLVAAERIQHEIEAKYRSS